MDRNTDLCVELRVYNVYLTMANSPHSLFYQTFEWYVKNYFTNNWIEQLQASDIELYPAEFGTFFGAKPTKLQYLYLILE